MFLFLKEKFLQTARSIAFSAGLMLFLAGLTIRLTGDARKAAIRRVDNTSAWSENLQSGLRSNNPMPRRDLLLAALYYKNLLAAFPALPGASGAAGYCYAMAGMTNDAMRFFKRGLSACPSCFWFSYNAAVLAFRNKNTAEAEQYLKTALAHSQETAIRSVILAPLTRLPAEQRQHLFLEALAFAENIRTLSWKARIALRLMAKERDKARDLSIQALEDPLVKDKVYFLKILVLLNTSDTPVTADNSILTDIVIHPWAKTIPIGRESHF